MAGRKKYIKVCEICGVEFTASGNTAKYCGDACRNEADKRRKHYGPYVQCTETNKSLTEMAVEARKHGMSYGQYVALLETQKNQGIRGKIKRKKSS